MRRTVPNSPASLLPLSVSPTAESASSPHQRHVRRNRSRTASNDWLVVGQKTVGRLIAVGIVAFVGIHLYLLHNLFMGQHGTGHAVSVTDKVIRSGNTTDDALPADDNSRISLRPLTLTDYQQYTIRINTWKREETLQISLQHHVTCAGVAQIQVVWAMDQGAPPDWLVSFHEKVLIEQHAVNSLNERFNILDPPAPTLGILSLDDDILRPCAAYDWAFYKWTMNPDRIVGFDARSHEVAKHGGGGATAGEWEYAYKSTTEKTNQYSLTLTRCCFLHADYLNWYMQSPHLAPIRQMVQQHLNCEDIGMSLLVSSQTGGRPPLLADYWVVKSMIKLDDGSNRKISAGPDHKQVRDHCLNQFADWLKLKTSLKSAVLKHHHHALFEYGEKATDWNVRPVAADEPQHLQDVKMLVEYWKKDSSHFSEELSQLRMKASMAAYQAGLVEGSDVWKKRFHVHSN